MKAAQIRQIQGHRDQKINLVFHQIIDQLLAHTAHKGKRNLRVLRPKAPNRAYRDLLLNGRGQCKGNGVIPGNLAHIACSLLPNADDLLTCRAEGSACGRQLYMGCVARKEGRAEFPLQYLDLTGDGRLGNIVFFRRLGETQAVGNTQKIAQLL